MNSMRNNVENLRDLMGQANLIRKFDTEECYIGELLQNPYNRDIDQLKVIQIKRDILSTGKVIPLVYSEVDHDGKPAKMIVDGHHRYQALKELGYNKVPIVRQDERGVKTKAPKEEVEKVIRREGSKWVLYSKDGSKKLGESSTKEGILRRERQVQYFKHKK